VHCIQTECLLRYYIIISVVVVVVIVGHDNPSGIIASMYLDYHTPWYSRLCALCSISLLLGVKVKVKVKVQPAKSSRQPPAAVQPCPKSQYGPTIPQSGVAAAHNCPKHPSAARVERI